MPPPASRSRPRGKDAGVVPASSARKAGGSRSSAKPAPAPATSAAEAVGSRYSHSDAQRPSAAALEQRVDDLESDDEEAPRNRAGNVPREWYDGEDHVGYDLSGGKVSRPARKDGLDRVLAAADDPSYRWTVFDEELGEDITLSKRDLQILTRMHAGAVAMPETDMYEDCTDIFCATKEIHAMGSEPNEPKRRFLPSKWETQRINKIVRAIREGRYKKAPRPTPPECYLLWGEDGGALDYTGRARAPPAIPAPKPPLPGHAHSYNPPPEYLLSPAEEAAWLAAHPSERPNGLDFIPRRFTSLRHVPLYAPGARERFERCLDLYLCPRLTRRREDRTPEALLPQLPEPAALKPFPSALGVSYEGHSARVRSLSFDPAGARLATGSDDGSLRLWDVASGRCLASWALGAPVVHVAWNPAAEVQVIAACVGSDLLLLYPGTATRANAQATFDALTGARREGGAAAAAAAADAAGEGAPPPAKRPTVAGAEPSEEEEEAAAGAAGAAAGEPALRTCTWSRVGPALGSPADLLPSLSGGGRTGVLLRVSHAGSLAQAAWHRKGDYCATIAPRAAAGQVMIHQLSRHASVCPLHAVKGAPQAVAFHPTKPHLLVASQRTVRVYHLLREELLQKLESGCQWISSLAVHPSGDHVLVGSHDARVAWFDTELASSPWRTLRYHTKAVRRCAFHPGATPLMATASDDGSVHVFHARVAADYATNPIVVPVKILRGHTVTPEGLGVLDVAFHPTLPWLATAGADGQVKLWINLP